MKLIKTATYSILTLILFAGLSNAQQMYIYPNKGQSQAQKNKDMSQCNTWAVNQTGFDPAAPYYPSGPGPRQPRGQAGLEHFSANLIRIGVAKVRPLTVVLQRVKPALEPIKLSRRDLIDVPPS